MNSNIVFSGMGPTGRLHLGHYHGVLKNWCLLQNTQDCFFMIADLAALTTHYESRDVIKNNIWEMLVDWLSAGIEPDKSTVFIQSRVPEHVELAWLLGMITPVNWLQDIPAYHEKITKLTEKDLSTFGYLGDPVMQTADILAYKATVIPVGLDQVNHLKFTSDVVKRFNALYGERDDNILYEPQPHLNAESSLPGIDGDKMSKSYGNAIFMRSSSQEIERQVENMTTAKMAGSELGNPSDCPVFEFHNVYSSPNECMSIQTDCIKGFLSCSDCKRPLADSIISEQFSIKQRAEKFLAAPKLLEDIIDDGCKKARRVAQETLQEVRDVMGLRYDRPSFPD